MTNNQELSKLFDEYYFRHGCGEPYERNEVWMSLFAGFADRIVSDIAPGTVLDAGCAKGFLVECLRARGVEAWGVDVSEHAIENVPESVQEYCWVGSITEPLPRDYDLVVCIEVLEHMTPQESHKAVANLCRHTADVLFSSTPFDYKEVSHLNVQPPEYWAGLFARHGFYRDVDFDASFLTPWAVRFRRMQEPVPRLVQNYERKFWLLWKENTDLRKLTFEMREQLAEREHTLNQLESNPLWRGIRKLGRRFNRSKRSGN